MARSGPDDRAEFAGTIEIDISCTRCGYNLRSLAVDGQCPECNASVSASLNADRLMFADPTWLSGIARGLTVILWSLVSGFGVSVCVGVGPVIWEALGFAPLGMRTVVHEYEGGRATATYNVFQEIIPLIIRPVSLSVMMLGVYMCTRRDESEVASRIGRRRRRASRVLAILCALVALAPLFLVDQVKILVHKLPTGIQVGIAVPNLRSFLDLAWIISLSLVVPVFFYWLASVAGRIPDGRLVRWCRRLGFLYATLTIVAFALRPFPAFQTSVFALSLFRLAAVGFVANVIGIVVLLVAYRRTLRSLIPACLSLEECFAQDGRSSPQRTVGADPTGDRRE